MKPIIQEKTQDTILTKDITEQHIVVAVIFNKPRLLSKGWAEKDEKRHFFNLTDRFSSGNGINVGIGCNIKQNVEFCIKNGHKVAVFHQSDWKQALQWLIYNA